MIDSLDILGNSDIFNGDQAKNQSQSYKNLAKSIKDWHP